MNKIIQSEPKYTDKKIQKIQKIALDVMNKRMQHLKMALIQCDEKEFFYKMLDFYYKMIARWKYYKPKIANFKLQIFIAGTRSWEGLSINRKGERRFRINDALVITKIKEDHQKSMVYLNQDVAIVKIDNSHDVLLKVKENLIANYQILENVYGNTISKPKIEQFFNKTKFYTFQFTHHTRENVKKYKVLDSFINANNLQGLSSYDGSRTFVNQDLFQFEDSQNIFKNLELLIWLHNEDPIEFNELTPIYKLIITLEHECCHNIPRWCMQNMDPLLISPEMYGKLKIEEMDQEAGYYYTKMAYNIFSLVKSFLPKFQFLG